MTRAAKRPAMDNEGDTHSARQPTPPGPGPAPRAMQTWRELRRLMGTSYDALDRSLRSGASGSLIQFEALDLLAQAARDEPVRQTVLQEGLNLSQSGVSRLVSRLHAAGFIERVSSAEDARTTLITLTEIGRRARNADAAAFDEQFRHELDTISRTLGRPSKVESGELLLSAPLEDDGTEPAVLPFGESDLAVTGSAARVAEAVVVRELLEPLVLLDAARNHRRADIAECRQILEAMRQNLTNPMEFFRADWRLHRRLLQISHNQLLAHLYDSLLTVIESTFTEVVATDQLTDYLRRRLRVHENLIDAVASRNHDLVQFAAREHAFTSRTVDFLEQQA